MLLDSGSNPLALLIVNGNDRADRRAVVDKAFEFGFLKTGWVDGNAGSPCLKGPRRCGLDDGAASGLGSNARGIVLRRHGNLTAHKHSCDWWSGRLPEITMVSSDLLLFLVRSGVWRGLGSWGSRSEAWLGSWATRGFGGGKSSGCCEKNSCKHEAHDGWGRHRENHSQTSCGGEEFATSGVRRAVVAWFLEECWFFFERLGIFTGLTDQ